LATDGYRAFLNLQDALRAGRPVALECELFPGDTESCKDIILKLGQSDISDIQACDKGGETRSCFVAEGYDRKLTINIADGNRDLNVASAKLESLIIFADALID
jgi:hypothetical protein